METNKPKLENINASSDSTIQVKEFADEEVNVYKLWHYHKELELIYINKGRGKRYIGSHIDYFRGGELILIGAFLPHYSFIDPIMKAQKKISIQVREGFPGVSLLMFPEMQSVKQLLEKARRGISFYGETRKSVGKKVEEIVGAPPQQRFISFLEILIELSVSEEYQVLNSGDYQLEITTQDNERLRNIFNFVRENFTRQISLEEIAEESSMTPPSFARYFKKNTGKTFTQFVNEYRLVHASKLLAEKPTSITDICYESGFNNFSHFNKLFKEYSGKSPSEYRKEFKQLVS
jgi:AraC-like DNA-binding protein